MNGQASEPLQHPGEAPSAVPAATTSSSSAASVPSPRPDAPRRLHFVVVVLGDVGRSPRMQYHALSLLRAGHNVTLVGYVGEDIIPALKPFEPADDSRDRGDDDDGGDSTQAAWLRVARFRVPAPPGLVGRVRPLYFVWRILSLAVCLLNTLLSRVSQEADCLLVQNPPALPLLVVAYLFRFLQRRGLLRVRGRRSSPAGTARRRKPAAAAVVIDWHNLGYSMLGEGGVFRRVAEAYERRTAPLADGHLAVTRAMRDFLAGEMELAPSSLRVVPDCPPDIFRPLPLREQHEILAKLHPDFCRSVPATWSTNASPDASNASDVATTLLTEHIRSRGEHRVRRGRPALVTSSTSWTPDEDFGVLLSALLGLDAKIESETSSLRVLVVVTGKGPQKREYEERMSHLRLRNVAVQTLWLEPADYPKLLACADVGVSLHTSTSGLDLPMKVLDLFGCEVPVCALSFACLSELVEDGTNGRVFESAGGLCDLLWELLSPLASEPSAPAHGFGPLATYSANLKGMPRWDDQWKENALPFLLKTIEDARL